MKKQKIDVTGFVLMTQLFLVVFFIIGGVFFMTPKVSVAALGTGEETCQEMQPCGSLVGLTCADPGVCSDIVEGNCYCDPEDPAPPPPDDCRQHPNPDGTNSWCQPEATMRCNFSNGRCELKPKDPPLALGAWCSGPLWLDPAAQAAGAKEGICQAGTVCDSKRSGNACGTNKCISTTPGLAGNFSCISPGTLHNGESCGTNSTACISGNCQIGYCLPSNIIYVSAEKDCILKGKKCSSEGYTCDVKNDSITYNYCVLYPPADPTCAQRNPHNPIGQKVCEGGDAFQGSLPQRIIKKGVGVLKGWLHLNNGSRLSTTQVQNFGGPNEDTNTYQIIATPAEGSQYSPVADMLNPTDSSQINVTVTPDTIPVSQGGHPILMGTGPGCTNTPNDGICCAGAGEVQSTTNADCGGCAATGSCSTPAYSPLSITINQSSGTIREPGQAFSYLVTVHADANYASNRITDLVAEGTLPTGSTLSSCTSSTSRTISSDGSGGMQGILDPSSSFTCTYSGTAPTNDLDYNIVFSAFNFDDASQARSSLPLVVYPTASSNDPNGTLSGADCSSPYSTINGWSSDADSPNVQEDVRIYDGPASSNVLIAQVPTDINHTFNLLTPDSVRTNTNHYIYAYGVDTTTGENILLGGSPKTVHCSAVPNQYPVLENASIIPQQSVRANGNTNYAILINGADGNGGADIVAEYAAINQGGSNTRGYVGWSSTTTFPGESPSSYISCSGGGYAAKFSSGGSSYINLINCSTTVSGNTRIVAFQVSFNSSFTTPATGNTISGWLKDAGGLTYGWASSGTFDLDFTNYCTVPSTGNWTVSSSCTIPNTVFAPGSVTVNAGIKLTIPSKTTLLIDLKHFKLLVKYGGGVLVKHGGSVQQS